MAAFLVSCVASQAGITSQIIAFDNPGAQTFATTPTLTATSDSGLTVDFSSTTTGVCTISGGGALVFVTAGTCTIEANQAGDDIYAAASAVQHSFTVDAVVPGAPTIGAATAGDIEASVSFTAPANDGGLAITDYTVTSSPSNITATGASSPITVTGLDNGVAYTFTVTATNGAGTGSTSAASNSATPRGSQTITFANPGAQNFGTSPTLSASSTSGLTVGFSSTTPGICTVSGVTLTFLAAGTCDIDADQAGNAAYLPAPTQPQSFTVSALFPSGPTISAATAGDSQASITFTAPASDGGSPITGYTVTSDPEGITGTGASSPIVVSGLTNGVAYTFTVTATNSAGTGLGSPPSNTATPRGNQTITFANPDTQNFGTSPTLSASSTSGLTVGFSSTTTGVCTVTGDGTLTFVAAGTCDIDADQAGNAAYLPATTQQQSFTVNAVVPGAPTIGTATAGDGQASVSFTAPASLGGAPITEYIMTANPGGNASAGSSSPIVVAGLTNGTPYTFTVTAANSAGRSDDSGASNSATPRANQTITFANPDTQNFGTSPTLSAGSTSDLTVAFTSSTTDVCTISGGGALAFVTAGTCTIVANQAGDATYAAASAVQQSFTVNAVVPGAPTIGTATAGDGQASVSFTAPASLGGAPIIEYIMTANPGGNASAGSSSPIVVAGLDNGVAYTFTVTATTGAGTGSASAASNEVTPAVAIAAPIAGAASVTVAYGSSANPVTLALTGGAPTSVAIGTAASHGTATASGTSITYTPTVGYVGSDSFTYTATNGTGTSAPATVTVTITAPTLALSPAAGALPDGTVGAAYSQTISSSTGNAPFSFERTAGALPSGVTLNAASGSISGTPTTQGDYSFTVTVIDDNGIEGAASFTLKVNPAVVASFVFSPAGGALPAAMVGEDYSQAILASGGSGSLLYSLASGTLPDGLVLNVSTGALTGPLDDAAVVGNYSFTLHATDADSHTATAAFTLRVNARAIAVADKTVAVAAGDAPLNVDLTQGATGGPFTAGELASVSPPNAGTVTIVNGEFAGPVGTLGWYLKFIPNPAYKGQVTVSYRLTSALGVSNLGVIVYNVAYDPGEVAVNVDTLVHGFVQTRQNLIVTTIAVPGLLERRQMAMAQSAVSGRVTPGENGITTTFATSLTQMQAAKARADGVAAAPSAFNAWMSGSVMMHDREANGGNWGSFAMLSAGADYLLSEHALVGLSLHYDRMVDPTEEDARLTGNGWLAGPYGSFEVADGIYWDTSLLYGGSSNTIDTSFWDGEFETSRWMIDTALKGELALGNGAKLMPKLRALYLSETVKDYSVDNADGDLLDLRGFTTDQLRVSIGADYSRKIALDDGASLTPRLGATAGFAGLDGSGLFGTVSAGLSFSPVDAWNIDLGLLVGVEGDGQTAAGAKVGITGRF